MPDVSFTNSLKQHIHIGLWIGWLDHYGNSIAPGASWTAHLASMPYTIEVRIETGANGFSKAEGDAKVGEMLGAVGQGTLSVLAGLGWGLGVMGVGGRPAQATSVALTGRAWQASSETMQNAIQGGVRYFTSDGDGHILSTQQLIGFENMRYEIRSSNDQVQLYEPRAYSVRAEALAPVISSPVIVAS
ncbi:hypothetical protein PENSPDRAFT_759578 [Peniophora sp. CONT]|nr:hypothetical protein PENSPDRAFT_759578 [Peniophora sp. CONT]